MRLLAVQELAGTAEHRDDGNTFDGRVVLLGYIEVLVTFANIDVDDVIVLIHPRRDISLMEAIVQGKTVEAPIGSEDEKHPFVIFGRSTQCIGNFLVGIRIVRIELTKPT